MANFVFETIQVGNLNDIEFSSETGEPLRKFHNWIKQQLIFESKRITNGSKLLDVAVGRGGDIFKWSRARFKYVTGFDSDAKSIYEKNDFDGAIKRFNGVKSEMNMPKCYFWHMSATDPFILNLLNCKDHNIMYDVVSCQFSFHYFVEDINVVLNMISKKLKSKGIFIGTATDGDLIKQNLKNTPAIIKSAINLKYISDDMYEFSLNSEKTSRETYFEYRGVSREYYLSKAFLIDKCKEFNMYPVSILSFHEWNKNYMGMQMSKEEMACSFLNFSFVFQKY
jgi:ubiquinone/menaquinone biosynthesis C-methylase UbiE